MNAQRETFPGDQLPEQTSEIPLFAVDDTDVFDLGPRQTASDWARLALAAACAGLAVVLTGQRFIAYVVHQVWDHSRNSPSALIVPVLAIEFLWMAAHIHTGGLIARLKIALGAAGMCMALFAPLAGAAGQGNSFDLRQALALILTSWVFVDGWRDRGRNLTRDEVAPHFGQPRS